MLLLNGTALLIKFFIIILFQIISIELMITIIAVCVIDKSPVVVNIFNIKDQCQRTTTNNITVN